MTDIFQLLGAAGDFGIIAVGAMFWRLDRRLVRLETLLNGKKKK